MPGMFDDLAQPVPRPQAPAPPAAPGQAVEIAHGNRGVSVYLEPPTQGAPAPQAQQPPPASIAPAPAPQAAPQAQDAPTDAAPATSGMFADLGGPKPAGGGQDPVRPTSQTLGFMEGLEHPLQRFQQFNDATLGALPVVGGFFHSTPEQQQAQQGAQRYLAQREMTEQPGGFGKFAGEVVGTAPVAGLGPLLGGALSGALTSNADSAGGTLRDMAIGGAGGKVGDMLLSGLQGAIVPQLSAHVKDLLKEGVGLTPGQILGGGWQRVEDGLTSIPMLGDMINGGKARSVQDFNRAAINRTLTPIGQQLPGGLSAGYEAVDHAHQALSDAYEALTPKLTTRIDQPFQAAVANLTSLAQNLHPDYVSKFNNLLKTEVLDRFAPQTGVMLGDSLKQAEEVLGKQARRFGRSDDPHAQDYADAVTELQSQLRGLVQRSNPQLSARLKAINTGWANLVRVERAAAGAGAKGGVFTAPQLDRAVAMSDGRYGTVGRGKALMQDLSTAGKEVLPSTVPDSGSPLRHFLEATVAGLVGQEAHVLPLMAKGAALGATVGSMYTKTGQKIVTPLLTKRPQGAAALARALEHLRLPATGAAAVAPVMAIPQRGGN